MESRVIPAAAPPQPATLNDFGTVLSPSQVRTFRDCGAKWYYKYALGLPDPPNGSLVRGRVVHQMAETFFRAKLDGGSPDPDDLQASFEEAWDTAAAQAAFGADEDVDLLKRQAAMLTRKYLDEVAPEIEPAALELPVQGVIGGVPVRGFVDLLDASGRIIDLKTAARKPTGVSADYAFQLATYRQLCPGGHREGARGSPGGHQEPASGHAGVYGITGGFEDDREAVPIGAGGHAGGDLPAKPRE
jgi:RecB family exonuclease